MNDLKIVAPTIPIRMGDIGLSRGSGWIDGAIRRCEEQRYGHDDFRTWANHAFFCVDNAGGIIEAQGRGVVHSNLGGYTDSYIILRPPYILGNEFHALKQMTELVGSKYGYIEIVCQAISLWTQTRFRFMVSGQHICSGAVSVALERANIWIGTEPEFNTPADIINGAMTHDDDLPFTLVKDFEGIFAKHFDLAV